MSTSIVGLVLFGGWLGRSVMTYFGKSWSEVLSSMLSLFGYRLSPVSQNEPSDTWKRSTLLSAAVMLTLMAVYSLDDLKRGFQLTGVITGIIPAVLTVAANTKKVIPRSVIATAFAWAVTAPVVIISLSRDVSFPITHTICYSVSGGFLTALLMLKSSAESTDRSLLMMFITLVAVIHSVSGLVIASACMRIVTCCIMLIDALVTIGYTTPHKISPQVVSLLKGILVPAFGIVTLMTNVPYRGYEYFGVVTCFMFAIALHHISAVLFAEIWFHLMSSVTIEELTEYKNTAVCILQDEVEPSKEKEQPALINESVEL